VTRPALAHDDRLVNAPPRDDGSGAQEVVAAGLLTLVAAFFWWRGFRLFTVVGSALFIVALLRLAEHRRRATKVRSAGGTRVGRVLAGVTTLAILAFPALLLVRWLGAGLSNATATPSGDQWLGIMLYVMGWMELVELATLRALDDP
jgi:uncharacterized membrane protein